MKIGIMAGATDGPDNSIDGIIAFAKNVEARGFDSLWMANIFGFDAISTLGFIGRETQKLELGTAVVPTYPRHPTAIAQQALTTHAASNGRFNLGIGLSHKMVIENMLGFSYDKPAKHMREYLSVLAPLLRGEAAAFAGEQYNVNLALNIPSPKPLPLLVAALGDMMLKLTGELADGTVTWMTGANTLSSHIAPKINKAASAAGRPTPRIVAGFPVVVTNDVAGAKEVINKELAIYGQLPSYRAMLDKEGAQGPADIALVGDADEIKSRLNQLQDCGVTDFTAAIVPYGEGSEERTLDCLQGLIA